MNVLEISELTKTYSNNYGTVDAVRNVSLTIAEGASIGLVGESGCGKSTLARMITRLETPDYGCIILCGEDITWLERNTLRKARRNIKMVFQDPLSSFDPRLTIGASIRDALRINSGLQGKDIKNEIARLLEEVELDPDYQNAFPHEISGGECQRAAIARAIATQPKLLICDEVTSALDVSIQAQIVQLLRGLGDRTGMSFLFISHNIALVCSFCSHIHVMYNGEIVEHAPAHQLISAPQNTYTKLLLNSAL